MYWRGLLCYECLIGDPLVSVSNQPCRVVQQCSTQDLRLSDPEPFFDTMIDQFFLLDSTISATTKNKYSGWVGTAERVRQIDDLT